MKKVDLAYMAGFFDGEGTIGIYSDALQKNVVRISYNKRGTIKHDLPDKN